MTTRLNNSTRYRLSRITIPDLSLSHMRLGLIAAIAVHFMILGLLYADLIHDPFHQPGTWLFHQGGDQIDYFALAQSILNGQLISSKFTLGYPLLLVPWMLILHPNTATALIPISAVFHACILFPLAQLIFLGLAYRVTHHRTMALVSLLLWTLAPVIVYLPLAVTGRADLGGIWAGHLAWLQMLSDPPTALLTLLSFWLMFQIIDRPARSSVGWAIALGFMCGFLLLLRINTVLSLIVICLVLGIARRWLALGIVLALTLVCFSPQLVYNTAFFGSPFAWGYEILDKQPPQGLISLSYPLAAFIGKSGILIGVAAILLMGAFAAGGYALWRVDRLGAVVVSLWGAAYLIFFAFYYYSWTGSFFRFLIPAYSAYALLGVQLAFKGNAQTAPKA